jgi:type VI secretion system protein VasJ
MADLSALASLGKDPIPGDNPVGTSVQDDPDFEAIKAEIQKLDRVDGDPIDWRVVIDKGSEILESKSKHLLVAIYLARGLLERDDCPGFATGLTILRDLITTYWDTMEPPRARGRINGIDWLNKRAGKALESRKPSSSDKDAVDACQTALSEIGVALEEKLGGDAPSLSDVNRAIRDYKKVLEAAEKAATDRQERADKVASGEIDESSTTDDARKILAQTRTTIRKICEIMRTASPSDPIPYRLLRAITWAELREAPPESDGTTQISPPSPDRVSHLLELKVKNDWAALVQDAEAAFVDSPLWLDAHMFSAQALEALGEQHDAAAEAVQGELASLLARIPDLVGLQFSGGTPFASPETRKWIETEVQSRMGGGRGRAVAGGGNAPEGLAEVTERARQLAQRGKLAEAIQRMQEGIAATGEQRARFLWRLELARLCLDSGRVVLAAPLLEELEGIIERHQMETWEPDLCKAVYKARLGTRQLLLKDTRKATPELVQKTNQLYDRLSRLDPTAVLSLDSK